MKQPSLEEVKEYFKNAKKVKCLWTKRKVNITKKIITEAYKNCSGDVWIVIDGHIGGGVLLYNETTSEYAEILTYKEKTFSITESQIKQLEETETTYGKDSLLHRFFPEAFESEVKLEVGKWYFVERSKSQFDDKQRALVFYEDKEKIYGFTHGGWWCNDYGNPKYDKYKFTEATGQEVFEALKNEAIKRGFVKSVCFTPANANDDRIVNITSDERYCFVKWDNKLLINNWACFYDGKWAEILETITLSEAEQELKKKIIV